MATVNALEQFEFHQTLESTAGIAIVFFSSRECMSCRHWDNVLEHFSKQHPDVSIYKIDAGLDQALTEEFDVFHLPSFFLYYDGKYHSALQSEANLKALEISVKQALESPAEEMP